MAEYRLEAERSAWIKSRHWPDRKAAQRRAEILARKARKFERGKAGLSDTAFSETETKNTLQRWTGHEDTRTSVLGYTAWVIVFCVVVPIFFGIAWLVGQGTYRAWERISAKHPVKVWPYAAAALAVALLSVLARPLAWDLWLVHLLAHLLETFTGGLLAPEVLSRWYAAGWVSWMKLNLVLGLLYGGWLAFAWGWAAPAVHRRDREARQSRQAASAVRKAAEAKEAAKDTDDSAAPEKPRAKASKSDVTKIIG